MATNAEKLQLVQSDLRKNAEDRRQLRDVILGMEKEKVNCKHLWEEMTSLNVDRDNLLEEKKKLEAEAKAEAAGGAPSTVVVPDADRRRDQQAAAHSSPAPLRGFGGYSVGLLLRLLRAFQASSTCKEFVELPAWSRLDACSAQLGASPLLLLMHLAGGLVNGSAQLLVDSVAGWLQSFAARYCPAWLQQALPVVVRNWLGGIALQVAVFLATGAVEYLIMWLLFAAAQLLP